MSPAPVAERSEVSAPAVAPPAPPALSRRSFLGLAALAGASVAIPVALAERQPSLAELLVASRFLPHIGSEYTFDADDGRIVLTLVDVEGVGRVDRTDRAFTLRFDGPPALSQGGQVGQLAGPDLRGIPLLVVPSGRSMDGHQEWSATIVGGDPT